MSVVATQTPPVPSLAPAEWCTESLALEPQIVGALASGALRAEAELTPKPGLVDLRGRGSHTDMDMGLMLRSCAALEPWFVALARTARDAADGTRTDVDLRRRLGLIGRQAEAAMLEATGGVNTHRGAIFNLGFLAAGAVHARTVAPIEVATAAGEMAAVADPAARRVWSHGELARARRPGVGAAAHAASGFPVVVGVALPTLYEGRRREVEERMARIDALLATMAVLDDTCVLYRGGIDGLELIQRGAAGVLAAGGSSTRLGRRRLAWLDHRCQAERLSPGGSADVLAAALFLDLLNRYDNGGMHADLDL
jgi:triphosphoribosyl-dephospho-CoA synthase